MLARSLFPVNQQEAEYTLATNPTSLIGQSRVAGGVHTRLLALLCVDLVKLQLDARAVESFRLPSLLDRI